MITTKTDHLPFHLVGESTAELSLPLQNCDFVLSQFISLTPTFKSRSIHSQK